MFVMSDLETTREFTTLMIIYARITVLAGIDRCMPHYEAWIKVRPKSRAVCPVCFFSHYFIVNVDIPVKYNSNQKYENLIVSSSFIWLEAHVLSPAPTFLIALQCTRGNHIECFEIRHSLEIKKRFQIHGSSDGLVWLWDNPLWYSSPICICNPSVKKFVFLPTAIIPFRIK